MKLVVALAVTLALAIAATTVALASAGGASPRGGMDVVCKLSPAGMAAARALEPTAKAGHVTPEQIRALCNL